MSECTYRAAVLHVDPDDVYRSVRLVNGFRSWSDPTREAFQVGTATIEVTPYGVEWAMLVNDGTEEDVRNTLARLGFDPAIDVTEIKPHPVRVRA